MRKDVKLGFAIGGVLLAVVIVFALVNSRPKVANEPSEDPNTVAQADGTDTTKSEANKSADVKGTDTKVADTKTGDKAPVNDTKTTDTGKTAVVSGDTKSTDTKAGDTMFKNTGSTDWDKSFTTGTPVLAANQPVKLTETPVNTGTKTTGVSTATDNGAGTVSTGAAGFSYVNSSQTPTKTPVTAATATQHPQYPDSDEVVRGTGTTNDKSIVDLNKTKSSASQATSYTIKNGDTFSIIASAHYGAAKYYKLILAANPKVDPSHLKIGTVISLPAINEKADTVNSTPAASTEKPINATTQYRVQSGDNLHRICVKLYGDAKQVDALYEANKSAIGSDPAKLKLGMILTLPTAPTTKS